MSRPRNLLAAAAVAVGLLAAGCTADATSTATVEQAATGRLSPLSADELQRARMALTTLPRPNGWLRGVVLEENVKGDDWWRVLGDGGVYVLEPSYSCLHGDPESIGRMIVPGDGIAWSTKGHDNRVCPNEIKVTALGAVEQVPHA